MGRVLPQVAAVLSQYPDVFRVTNDAVRLIDEASESNGNEDDLVASRSERVNQVMLSLRDKDTVPALRGWRGEV
jgi:ribonuclease D